jgi:hypothetical protein
MNKKIQLFLSAVLISTALQAASYTISGTITTSDGALLNGVTITYNGGSTSSNASGYYSFVVDSGAFSALTITPSISGYVFAPADTTLKKITSNKTANFTAVPLFTISGTVTTSEGTALAGVSIKYNDSLTSTNASGFYSFKAAKDSIVIITPSKDLYKFSPEFMNIWLVSADQTVNFTAQLTDIDGDAITVSGVVSTVGDSLIPGVTIAYDQGVVTTDSQGAYSLKVDPDFSSSVNIFPSKDSFAFVPAFFKLTDLTSNQTVDFTALPYIDSDSDNITVSGRVYDNTYNGVGSVIITYEGGLVITNTDGTYSFTIDPDSLSSLSMLPSKEGYLIDAYSVEDLSDDLTIDFLATPSYTVSGTITTSTGAALGAATVEYADGVTITNTSGYYSFEAAKYATVQITPSKSTYVFTPSIDTVSMLISDTTINFTASSSDLDNDAITISGTVSTSADSLIAGAVISYNGKITLTDSLGKYAIKVDPDMASSLTIIPVKEGFTFNPASQTYTNFTSNHTLNIEATLIPEYDGDEITVCGTIKTAGDSLAGVRVAYGNRLTKTDSLGHYSFIADPDKVTSLTIIPIKTGFTFSPGSYLLSDLSKNDTVDFIATAYVDTDSDDVTISGWVNNDSVGMQNVIITYNGGATLTNSSGNYSFSVDTGGLSSLTVSPGKYGYRFSPAEYTIADFTADTIADFTATEHSEKIIIRGLVAKDSSGICNAVIVWDGGTTLSDDEGYYSITVDTSVYHSISIRAIKDEYVFSPADTILTNIIESDTIDFNATSMYSIDGLITKTDGSPLSGVRVECNEDVVTTNASGYYSFDVAENTSLYIHPSQSLYTFDPVDYSIMPVNTDKTVDFTATFTDTDNDAIRISGKVSTQSAQPLSDVTIAFNGQLISTDASGNYSILIDPDFTTSVSVIPTKQGYTFNPGFTVITNLTSNQTLNFTATPYTDTDGDDITICGKVNYGNTPVALSNILIEYDGGATLTNTSGEYSFAVDPDNYTSMTIEAIKENYYFEPASTTLTSITTDTVDFTAYKKTYRELNGTVSLCGTGLDGVAVSDGIDTVYTSSDGSYSLNVFYIDNYLYPEINLYKENFVFRNNGTYTPVSLENISDDDFEAIPTTADTVRGNIRHKSSLAAFAQVKVSLYRNSTLLQTTQTAADGSYSFVISYDAVDNGTYYVQPQDTTPFSFTPASFEIPGTTASRHCSLSENKDFIAVVDPVSICVVSVNENNHNVVVWERPKTSFITDINIYRANTDGGSYELLASVPYEDGGLYEDTSSNPTTKSYSYRLVTTTTQGYDTDSSTQHSGSFLSLSQSDNNAWVLNWTKYEGLSYSAYKLYRGTSSDQLDFFTSFSKNVTTYTDAVPPTGTAYYQVGVVLASTCNPDTFLTGTKASGSVYSLAFSNVVNSSGNAINDNNADVEGLSIFPNPAHNKFTLRNSKNILRYEIVSISGKKLNGQDVNSSQYTVNINHLKAGIYLLRVYTKDSCRLIKFVKE